MLLLGRLEAILRELRVLLERGQSQNLCSPDRTGLTWTKTKSIDADKREFHCSIWEGTRAFEEGNVNWAGLCWQSALLQLEQLLWHPDLDLWTIFVRSCVGFHRLGAAGVGSLLLQKLQGLRHLLPLTAPHRAFVYALTDISFDELVDGGLFILEAKLRNIELLWPNNCHVHTDYQIDLAIERFYHGYDNVHIDSLTQEDLDNTSLDDLFGQTAMRASKISKCLILLDYPKAEELVQRWIIQLESHTETDSFNSTLNFQLAAQYATLGNIRYLQDKDTEAHESFILALKLHQNSLATSGEGALQKTQLHRIYTLLEWLTSQQSRILASSYDVFDIKSLKSALEDEIWMEVKVKESKPLPDNEISPLSWQEARLSHTKTPLEPGKKQPPSKQSKQSFMMPYVNEDKIPISDDKVRIKMLKRARTTSMKQPKRLSSSVKHRPLLTLY